MYLEEFSTLIMNAQKLKVYKTFRENRISYSDGNKKTASSVDKIGITQHVVQNVPLPGPGYLVFGSYPVLVDEEVFVNLEINSNRIFNFNSGIQAAQGDIIEDVHVNVAGTLALNHSGGYGGLISDPSLAISTPNVQSHYPVRLSESAIIDVGATSYSVTTSQLSVGENNQNTATLTVESGSKIKVGHNDELIVNNGSKIIFEVGSTLNLRPSSSLIIEDGAEVIFEPGSTFNRASDAEITINSTSEPSIAQLTLKEGVILGSSNGAL